MKSLIRGAKTSVKAAAEVKLDAVSHQEEAQCCAKVSKTVAGCHD